MTFIPNIVDNVTISILFYFHYFSNNVNKNNHILDQILHKHDKGIEKQIRSKTLFIIVFLLRYNTNLMQIIYYKVVCATYNSVILTTDTFVIITMFFLHFILMGLSVIWKKII